ncbi:MAG TPA: hypothetical protein DE315_02275 [Candidatus Omnitrophica bacterium]|nr:MAG: hypothetical protein A2Y05_03235 [Omnitrophica WOR_2 bacterium GWA2_53_43]HBO97428.1 hypothetical protein [Candidatus Omnitrophota bacterium]HCI44346.1 hypothetical protein [Candidatus Omnitrophota bacterium]
MPDKIIIVFILGAAISLAPFDVHARTDDAPAEEPAGPGSLFDPDEGSSELRVVKEQIQSQLRRNEELVPQAESLKREFLDLQEKVRQSRAAAVAVEKKQARGQEGLGQRIKKATQPGQPQSLRLLQSYDMQYQEKQLEIELRLRELALREKQQARDRQIAEMRKELEQNTIEEGRLAGEAEELKKQSGGPGYELEFLKQENILLENQLRLLKTSPEFAMMGQGLGELPGAVWQSIRQKEARREQLQREIARLEMELRSSSTDDNLFLFEAQFRGSVERLEKENKGLKDRISSFKKKIQKE